jgi:predicted transglutaminase-like cysteine proteinase
LQGPATTIINPTEPAKVTLDPYLAASDRPDIFGSIALPVAHTPLDAKWKSAHASRLSRSSGPWIPLLRSVAGESRSQQLKAVNHWVNARVHFTDDRAGKGGSDHWSTASETLLRSAGDCEDYAIAKMKLLEALGVARADLYLVIANDLVRRADHAVLVVRLDQRLMVLDSSSDQLLDARQVLDYRPIFSYGDRSAWVHGYLEKSTHIAAQF